LPKARNAIVAKSNAARSRQPGELDMAVAADWTAIASPITPCRTHSLIKTISIGSQNFRDNRTKYPRRGPNCGAKTPMPDPLLIS
jgi:hypothetical protein